MSGDFKSLEFFFNSLFYRYQTHIMKEDREEMPKDFPMPLMILWLFRGFLRFAIGQMLWRKPFDRFEPDLLLEVGQSLAADGFDAKVLYTPGHSKGSISILAVPQNLLCGLPQYHGSYLSATRGLQASAQNDHFDGQNVHL